MPSEPAQDAAAGLVQSVDRALVILELMAEAGGAMGITDLAAQLEVHKSTASRLMATLEAHDLVEQLAERGKYRLGFGLMHLAGAANLSLDLIDVARPAMRQLVDAVGETANLAVLSEDAAFYVDQLVGKYALQAHSWVGQRIPLHATSNGKVLLAYSPQTLTESLIARGLTGYAPSTITDGDALRRDLEVVRERGWALADDELEQGLTAVAAPIFDQANEVVGSLSVSGPTFRIASKIDELATAAVHAARITSSRLGHRGTKGPGTE